VFQRTYILLFFGFIFFAGVLASEVPGDKGLTNGQDFTRPLACFHAWSPHQLLLNKCPKNAFMFRTDWPFIISRHEAPGASFHLKPVFEPGRRGAQKGNSFMIKIFLRVVVGIGIMTLVLGTPPVHAIFGIRAARTIMAARKAKKLASSSQTKEANPQANQKIQNTEGQENLTEAGL